MLQPWQNGIVTKITPIAKNTNQYTITLENKDPFDFLPGQFVTLNLPIHEKASKCLRSYSIASAPNGTNSFELIIVLANPSTGGTDYIFDKISEGSSLILRGPVGVFTLPEIKDKNVIFICTGTGIAPFNSMLQHHLNSLKNKNTQFNLIFGCRTKEDLIYYNQLQDLDKEFANFNYHPTLSRETWEGKMGYVHNLYQEIINTPNFNRENALFYLCGWRTMIDDAKHNLLEMGFDKKQIHYELYG
jgi:ferredoxin-NADP reductase